LSYWPVTKLAEWSRNKGFHSVFVLRLTQ